MSLIPESRDHDQLTVHRTDLRPRDPEDTSKWKLFAEGLAAVVTGGAYLVGRWAVAKVRQSETDAEARKLEALGNYEKATAEAYERRLNADSQSAKSEAETRQCHAEARQAEARATFDEELVRRLLDPGTPQEAQDRLRETIDQIRMHGGYVEFELPEFDDEEDTDESPEG